MAERSYTRGHDASSLTPEHAVSAETMNPVVRLAGLRFAWGATPCLDIPRFDMAPGEQVFLHGPSGSGKSTLLNLLAGVLVPRSGELSVLGVSLPGLSGPGRDRFRADHLGMVFQQFNLIPHLSVLDNVLLPCRFSPLRRERAGDARAAAARLLRHLDLDEGLWRRPAAVLSVGQQQRVAAARALIGAPELVIADEPTSALDAERQAAFLDLLRQECSAANAALLFVSHDRRLAQGFDRQVALAEINHPPPPAGEGRGEGKAGPYAQEGAQTPLPHPQPLPRRGRRETP